MYIFVYILKYTCTNKSSQGMKPNKYICFKLLLMLLLLFLLLPFNLYSYRGWPFSTASSRDEMGRPFSAASSNEI